MRYYVIGHSFVSVFSCNKKVAEYIHKCMHASVFKRKERFCVCFGRYDAEQDARAKCNELKAAGINTRVVKGE